MKSALLLVLLIFVLASVHDVATRRIRVERHAQAEPEDGDNDNDDDDDDDDEEDGDPIKTSNNMGDGQRFGQQIGSGGQNTWSDKGIKSKNLQNTATAIQSQTGTATKSNPAAAATQTHWSGNQKHRKVHRQAHRPAQHRVQRQHFQNHQKNFRPTTYNRRSHHQPHYQSARRMGGNTGSKTFSNGNIIQKQNTKVGQNSNANMGGNNRAANSLKVNQASNNKPPRNTQNRRVIHNRRPHNTWNDAASQTSQPSRPQRKFNWRNRGLTINQPQSTLKPVTPKTTSATSVTRSWDHVTRQVSPQPIYTTSPPPVIRQNVKSAVVHNRWNNHRLGNTISNKVKTVSTSKEVNSRPSYTRSKSPHSTKPQLHTKHISSTSPRWQRTNNRFNRNQMNNRFQARNQWNNKRQQQSSSVGIVSQQRSYQNAKAARHSPVQGDTRRQSPARGEFIASSVKQSRKPNKAVQGVKRFPVDQSSHNSQTAELQSPDNRFSNAVYPNHVKTPQRTMYRPKTKYFNSRSGTVNMDASPGASKYTASRAGLSFPSSLPRTGSSTGATKWSAPTSQGTTTYNHRTKQSSSGQVNNRRFVPSSNVATLSTSSRRFTPQQAQVDNVSNARRGYQQINTRTQEVYGTTGNSQIKKQMPVDSTTNNRESPATPSLVSGSLNQWSNPATSQKIESESSPPNTRIKPARSPSEPLSGSVSESSSPTLISQNAWSSSFNRNTPHHQQQQEPSSDRNVPTSVVKSVQATHSVEESAIAPAVKTESSQPYGQYQEIRDQQPSTLSTANNWDSKSTSISATSFVPNTATRTSVKHQSMVTLFNENEPIPSFEAMGLARQPSETWSAPNNVELSSISPRKISPKIVNTQSPNTVHKSLARHLIREGTMEQVTKTKIEGNPNLKKKQISKMPATNEGSTFDHISVNGLSTKKPQQIYFSKNIDSKPQTVNHGASEGPIVAAGNSKDMTFFSSTLNINGGNANKPKTKPNIATTPSSLVPSPLESPLLHQQQQHHQQQQQSFIQGPKEVESGSRITVVSRTAPDTSRASSLTAHDTSRSASPTAPDTSISASPTAPATSRATSLTAPATSRVKSPTAPDTSRDTSLTAPDTSRSASPTAPDTSRGGAFSTLNSLSATLHDRSKTEPAVATGIFRSTSFVATDTLQSGLSGQQRHQSSVSSLSALDHPETVNFPNLDTAASLPNTISITERNIKTASFSNQDKNSASTSGIFSANQGNKNSVSSPPRESQQSTSGPVSISKPNKVKDSLTENTLEKMKISGSLSTGQEDNGPRLSQQSMVLHHNIDVIQSGTNSINQGGASLSTATSGVDVSHTNTAYETSRPDNSQQLQQPALQPVSFIDSINKEMAELTAQNRIPSANHEKKIRVIVPKHNNEWDTIVPSVPNILASMGRPKLSFGFDPGNTVQQIKRIPINDLNNEVIPTDNVYKKSKQSNAQSILDMAFGTSNYVTSGKRREKAITENTNSGKTEYESSKIDFVQYNTVDRRQAQSDPIKDVQEMYGVFSGALPNFGQSPFNVGLPGDQVYTPTSLITQQQKLGSQPTEKNIVRDQLSGRLEASPMDTGRKQQDGKSISGQTVNQVIDRLPTRDQRENNKDSVLNVNDRLTSNNEVNTGLQKPLGRRIQQDSAAVNSAGLSQPVKGTPQSVGVMTSSTVATTVAPAFSTRKLTTSHVILERLFDYNALVTTTPLPVTRNRDAVYTQMKNGPFVEGNKVTGALTDLTTTSVNQNNVIDNTKIISGPPKDGKDMTVPEKQNVRSTFNGNENVFTTRVTKTETINTLGNTKASNPESRSLVTFSNQHQPSFVSNSHNKIRKTAMPGWNADYSVANSLSGFGNLDLKVESAIKTKIPSSSTGISGEGKGAETINQKNVGSSVQPLTVTPIVVGTNGKSLIEKVVTGDTSLSSISKNNAKTQAKSTETTSKEPATISLSNPSGGQIISGDSSSISLVSRNTLEYGLDKTTKDSQDQLKPTGKHGITANTQTVFSVPPRAGNGNINDQKTEKIEANVGKTSKFQNAGKNLNKFSSDKRNFLRHHGMNADFRDPGLHSLSIGSSFGDVKGESRKLPAKAKWPVNKKQNSKSSYKFSRVVKSGFRKNRPNRTPLPSSRLQHKKSYRTAGTIRRRHHYKTG